MPNLEGLQVALLPRVGGRPLTYGPTSAVGAPAMGGEELVLPDGVVVNEQDPDASHFRDDLTFTVRRRWRQ